MSVLPPEYILSVIGAIIMMHENIRGMGQPCSNKIPSSGGCSAAGSVLSFNKDKVQKYIAMLYGLCLLFFFGSVLCVSNAVGSRHPVFIKGKTASKAVLQLQRSYKRQSQADTCDGLLVEKQCQSGALQDYRDLALQCNDSLVADFLVDYCSSNLNGDYCYNFDSDSLSDSITAICGRFPLTCTSDCRDSLFRTRSQLGCCISIINDSTSLLSNRLPFRNSLWSLCDVESVTQQCPSTIAETHIKASPKCTNLVYSERLYSDILCRQQYVESTNDALHEVGCGSDTFYTPMLEFCAVDESDQYCQLTPSLLSSQFRLASRACPDTRSCDQTCNETLKNIIGKTGCCFITEFNGTSSLQRYDWLSYEFWQKCGLTSPGFCKPRLSGAVTHKSQLAVILATTFMWIMRM